MLNIKYIESEIIDQFLADDNNRPWIIGFSGGKDSTMLLQLVWNALRQVPVEIRQTRQIYVVCNNTLVENPRILEFTERTLKAIELTSVKDDMPFLVQRTTPKLEDTFWVNLIGKGYRSPDNLFRWCTERLKINPTTKFILEKISDAGEAIILLGTRSAESNNRANSIKKHEIKGQRLRKHVLPNAFVYAPIKDVETEEVWLYLLQNPPSWGGHNRELVTLYRNASGGDCPLVIDKTTPSCGNSRFGCWVCTVVNRDKSMEGLIENGEEWMEPLLEIRDYLAASRFDMDLRESQRRNGAEGPGPYKPKIRAEILEKVLKAQQQIQAEEDPNLSLITHQELIAIQISWYRDGIFEHRVSDIFNKVYNKIDLIMDNQKQQLIKETELLQQVCEENPKHINLIHTLLDLHQAKILMQRKRGLASELEERLENFIKAESKEVQNAD